MPRLREVCEERCESHVFSITSPTSSTSHRLRNDQRGEDSPKICPCRFGVFFPLNWKRLWFCKQIVWLNHLISWSIRYNSKIPIVTCIVTYSWLIAMIYLHSNEMKHMSHMKQVFSMKIAMAMCLKISRFRSWETAPCPLWEFASKKLAANALHWRQGGCCFTWNLDFRKVHFRYFSAVLSFWGNWRQGKTLASCRAEMGTRKRVLKIV